MQKNSRNSYSKTGKVLKTGLYLAPILLCNIDVMAAFDVDAGVKAATDPLIKGLTDHWGKGVMLTGVGSALIGEGDSRQRAIRAGIGCAAAGATVLGLIALLK